jgi:hypothetical protein
MKTELKKYVSKILECGGSVKFPYKKSLPDWYSEVEISYNNEDDTYHIHNSKISGEYNTKEAINIFVDFIINDNNLAYVIDRIDTRNKNRLCEKYYFEKPEQELIDIIESEQKLIKNELNGQ